MKSPRFNCALAGCGRVAEHHMRFLRSMDRVAVVAVCDVTPGVAESFARRYSVPSVYGDFAVMLDSESLDVIHILTPPDTHAELAITALDARCHVVVEKPLACTAADAEKVVSAEGRTGRFAAVDHIHLFHPTYQRAKELLKQGVIGSLVGVDAACSHANLGVTGGHAHGPDWLGRLPGGSFLDVAVHPVYLLLDLIGHAHEVKAFFDPAGSWDARVLLRGARCLGSISFSTRARPFGNILRIYGTHGSLTVDLARMILTVHKGSRGAGLLGRGLGAFEEAGQLLYGTASVVAGFMTGRLRPYEGMGRFLAAFYRSLSEGTAPPVTADQGLAAIRIIETALSARRGLEEAPR